MVGRAASGIAGGPGGGRAHEQMSSGMMANVLPMCVAKAVG